MAVDTVNAASIGIDAYKMTVKGADGKEVVVYIPSAASLASYAGTRVLQYEVDGAKNNVTVIPQHGLITSKQVMKTTVRNSSLHLKQTNPHGSSRDMYPFLLTPTTTLLSWTALQTTIQQLKTKAL